MQKVLMVFLDGVGIGNTDHVNNPFLKLGFKAFTEVFGQVPTLEKTALTGKRARIFPVDALMGVEGFPQSGTGQTSIYCGVNASALIGMHFGPYPYSALLPVIEKDNIFQWYRAGNMPAVFANAYPKAFFEYLKTHKKRLSVTTISYVSAGHRLFKAPEVHRGTALTAEITNRRWNEKLNYKLPTIKPETAARRLLRIAARNTFTLYEYFMTDYIGHGRFPEEALQVHHNVDRLLYTILTEHQDDLTVVVVSDHGNYEDMSIKTHTLNPALGIVSGRGADKFAESVKSLPDIKTAVLALH